MAGPTWLFSNSPAAEFVRLAEQRRRQLPGRRRLRGVTALVANGGQSVAIADLNGDGRPDLATKPSTSYPSNGQPPRHRLGAPQQGRRHLQARSYNTGRTGPDGADVVVSDLNRDGRPDLVTAARGGSSVLVNRGDGSFRAKVEYLGPGASLASADLNGDDKPDLLTTGNRSLHVLINTPGLCNVAGRRRHDAGRPRSGSSHASTAGSGRSAAATRRGSRRAVWSRRSRGSARCSAAAARSTS